MSHLEMIERIKDLLGLSFENAREALEQNDWDLDRTLEALGWQAPEADDVSESDEPEASVSDDENAVEMEYVLFETPKRPKAPKSPKPPKPARAPRTRKSGQILSGTLRVLAWLNRLIQKGVENQVEVLHNGTVALTMPIIVFVLLLLLLPYLVMPLVVIGLFAGFRFYLSHNGVYREWINRAVDAVGNSAENLKENFCDMARSDATADDDDSLDTED